MNHSVNLIVALKAEAQPLIEFFELKPLPVDETISIFSNHELTLALAGMGKSAAARAVDCVNNTKQHCVNAWLNIGIAGHGEFDVGQGFLADRIVDQTTMKTWYPQFVFQPVCQTGALVTVEKVETDYSIPVGYDMEASGFYPAAINYSTIELVHSYKIVSDNPRNSAAKVTRTNINDLIKSKLSEIRCTVDSLKNLTAEVATRSSSDELLHQFLQRWRFSVTQQFQLKSLLRKTNILKIDIDVESNDFFSCRDGRSALKIVERTVETHWRS